MRTWIYDKLNESTRVVVIVLMMMRIAIIIMIIMIIIIIIIIIITVIIKSTVGPLPHKDKAYHPSASRPASPLPFLRLPFPRRSGSPWPVP